MCEGGGELEEGGGTADYRATLLVVAPMRLPALLCMCSLKWKRGVMAVSVLQEVLHNNACWENRKPIVTWTETDTVIV